MEIGRWTGAWIGQGFDRVGTVHVVGVAADVREIGLARPVRRTIYVPRAQWADAGGMLSRPRFVIRTNRPAVIQPMVVEAVRRADPTVPPPAFELMSHIAGSSIAEQRFQTTLLSLFAGSALLLTVIGIYGVVATAVSRQTREIGIRVALGARESQVLRRYVGRAMGLLTVGALIGLAGALGVTRVLRDMLFGVSPTDPATLVRVVAVLSGVGLVAAWIPARRAARVNPVDALRSE
jgi:hypothetical protein